MGVDTYHLRDSYDPMTGKWTPKADDDEKYDAYWMSRGKGTPIWSGGKKGGSMVTNYQGVEEGGSVCLRTSPYTGDVEVLLIRSTKKPYPWLPPKGHVESGEDAQTCAVRELEEETGFVGYPLYSIDHACIYIDNIKYDIEYFGVKIVGCIASKDVGRKFFWCPVEHASHLVEYPEVRAIINQASSSPYPGLSRREGR